MVDKQQQFFLPCFVVCAIFSAIISAQSQIRVDTDPAQVVVTENQRNVSLMCRVGRPIQFCTFTLPNSSQQVALMPGKPSANGLMYFGGGFEQGQCGVTIDRITTAHNGQVKCSVFVDGLSAEGLIDVVVAVPPTQPTIQLDSDARYFEAGKQITAHCLTFGGNPDPQLSWFLENDPIYDGVEKQQPFEQDGNVGTVLTLHRIINGNDNGKRLICRANHLAYAEGTSETSLQLAVSFPPLYLPEHTIHGLTLGRTVDVTLVIEANPKPRTHWTIDGVGIEEGTEHDRFAARVPEQLESGAYNVTLTIAGLTLEDLTKKYTLRASNDFGVQDYTVMLSSLDAEVDESGGVGIGGIIGIILAALIVAAAIALILVARATGRWCFRGKSTSTSTSNARIGETSDTESADLKQPITKTQRLKILFGRKRAAAEATGEIADNELAGAGAAADPEDYAGVDPAVGEGKRPTTTTSSKDEPTIVYAELELKPSEHSYVTKPESTEYAEILYVQKPGSGSVGASDPTGNDGARIPVVVTSDSATDGGERPAAGSTTTTTPSSAEKK